MTDAHIIEKAAHIIIEGGLCGDADRNGVRPCGQCA